jgi:hypothetical protein
MPSNEGRVHTAIHGGILTGDKPDLEGCFMKAIQESAVRPGHHAPAPSTSRIRATDSTASHDRVGHRLRAAYAGTLEEPLPVRLADLLTRFGEKERSRSDG